MTSLLHYKSNEWVLTSILGNDITEIKYKITYQDNKDNDYTMNILFQWVHVSVFVYIRGIVI